MNDTIEQRVTALLSPVINSNELNKSAMTQAIIFGLEMVNSYFDKLMEELFVDTMSLWGLDSYKKLFDIPVETDVNESKQIISDKIKQGFRCYESREFIDFLKAIDDNFYYRTKEFVTTIKNFNFSFLDSVPNLSKKLDELIPPIGVVYLEGGGASYQQWDDKDFTFAQYEVLNSPFSILDTL